ncbi:3-dehydroquinate synthase family protein [Vulcanisaeta distributa]|uniref:3-dehydroquinate synthase n=1 Tax=Vulcanisaeta distributa TaxID=164451 RepID=UPI000A64EEA9|nr:3-dehydroquinate synthase family protein [Vulcanisaeta distributa]
MREFTYRSRDGDVKVLININHGEALERITKDYTGCVAYASRSVANRVKIACPMIPIVDGEEGKSIETALNIVRSAHEMGVDRDGLFIGIGGGGSVLDVVGFSASIYLRGVDYVNVPTTMLSMVDASLGGKTGVNALGLKNVIGVIRQPRYVIIDLSFLDSLPMPNYLDGFAEVIKYGVTMDRELLDKVMGNTDGLINRDHSLLEDVVYKSLRDKANIVEADELDKGGVRAVLNYGHTVGHAIESATNFSVSHGRAVALGMVCEARVGVKLGYTLGMFLTY